jgi:hypothetical protein
MNSIYWLLWQGRRIVFYGVGTESLNTEISSWIQSVKNAKLAFVCIVRVVTFTDRHRDRWLAATAHVVFMSSMYCDNPNAVLRSRLENFAIPVTSLKSCRLRCDACSLGHTYERFGRICCLHFQNGGLDTVMRMRNVLLDTLVYVYQTSPKQNFDFIYCFAVRAVDQPRPRANACAFGADCMSCQWSVEVEETKIFFRLRECVFMTCAWSSVSVWRTC